MRSLKNRWITLLAVIALSLPAWAQHYRQKNLVSDKPGTATTTDPQLVNAWGLARSATSPWWVNDNGTGVSTIYDSSGAKKTLVVTIPPPTGSTGTSAPTGISFNGGPAFVVSNGAASAPANFIFVTEDGTISGWSGAVDPKNAILEVDNSGSAIYKGLALGAVDGAPRLYAANFASGKIEVYDGNWKPVSTTGDFADPALPPGYGAFAVHNLGGNIFVVFAKQSGGTDELHGRGLGYVDEFDASGNLLMRLQHGPWFNAPWGVAASPANFGQFSNNILVGNFGSGEIAAFDPKSGEFLGLLHGARGPLVIDGLWAIAFGGGNANSGPVNTLFFAAGIDDESHGLFGTLTPMP